MVFSFIGLKFSKFACFRYLFIIELSFEVYFDHFFPTLDAEIRISYSKQLSSFHFICQHSFIETATNFFSISVCYVVFELFTSLAHNENITMNWICHSVLYELHLHQHYNSLFQKMTELQYKRHRIEWSCWWSFTSLVICNIQATATTTNTTIICHALWSIIWPLFVNWFCKNIFLVHFVHKCD